MIEVYDLVTQQFDRGFDADRRMMAPMRRLLRRCVPIAASECERLFPLVIEAPGNIRYGPQIPAGYERLAVFATHKAAMSVGFNGWPEPIEEGPQISPSQFWHEMAKATTRR
jgi:hypothetical protein